MLYLGLDTIEHREAISFEQSRTELENELVDLASDISKDVFLKKIANGVNRFLETRSDNESIKNYIQALEKFLPTPFDLYVFDDNGKLITPREHNLRSRFLMNHIWQITRSDTEQQNSLYQRIRRQLSTFLGNEFNISLFLENPDTMLEIIVRYNHGRIYWKHDDKNPAKGIVMVFWEIPDLKKRLSITTDQTHQNLFSGLSVSSDHTFHKFGKRSISKELAKQLHRTFAYTNLKYSIINDILYVATNIENTMLIIGKPVTANCYKNSKNVFAALMLFVCFISCAFVALKRQNVRLSIKVKVTMLFLTSTLIPLMGFSYLSHIYLTDKQNTMRTKIESQSRQILTSIDESFRDAASHSYEDLNRIKELFSENHYSDLKPLIKQKIREKKLAGLEIRDTDSASIIMSQHNEMIFEGMSNVTNAFSAFAIDAQLDTNLSKNVEPLMTMVVTSPEARMLYMFDRPGESHRIGLGSVPLFLYWDLFENENKPLFILILQQASHILDMLVNQNMLHFLAQSTYKPHIVAARHNNSGRWAPASIFESNELTRFCNRAIYTDTPIANKITINQKEYLVVAQKGRVASDYSFFCFYPYELIRNEIEFLRNITILGFLFFIIVAASAGSLVSNYFLKPVDSLSQGVKAIEAKNSQFRIKTFQNDEFGDLATKFNQMIEDLKEMNMAEDIQKSLLPNTFTDTNGYQIAYYNKMASSVGGDFFDIHNPQPDKIALFIGDVTGHGVSSALVMAMVKAVVRQCLIEGLPLDETIREINDVIFNNFKAKKVNKMMSFIAAELDTQSGKLALCNSGHCYPFKVDLEGNIKEIKSIGYPLGALKKIRKIKTTFEELQPGESILLYTDGIVEIQNEQNDLFGYDRLSSELSAMRNKNASEIIAQFVESSNDFAGNKQPDDDITMIVVKNNNTVS